MKLDNTLSRIFTQIQKEVKDKFDKDLSNEEIFNVVESQLDATKEGLQRSITVHWIKFGKFLFTNKVVRKGRVYFTNSVLENNEDYTTSEKEQIQKQAILESALEKKYYSRTTACDKNIKEKELNVSQVLDKEVVKSTKVTFKVINRKKS